MSTTDATAFKGRMNDLVGEASQAARSIRVLSDMLMEYVIHCPQDKTSRSEDAVYETMWVFEQLSGYQRHMLEELEVGLKRIVSVEAHESDSETLPPAGMPMTEEFLKTAETGH